MTNIATLSYFMLIYAILTLHYNAVNGHTFEHYTVSQLHLTLIMDRTVLDMEVEGVRPRGRPKLRYMDTIKRDIKKNGLTDVNILDRKDWRLAVSRATH